MTEPAELPEHEPHPVRLVLDDDLKRNRWTVLFRLILAIPHLIWYVLWSILVLIVAVLNWIATLVAGTPPRAFHNLLCAYTRYSAHLSAYLGLVVDPYPGFVGDAEEYELDIQLPADPQPQPRLTTFFRLVLALPAILLAAALGGSFSVGSVFLNRGHGRTSRGSDGSGGGGLLTFVCAILGWFAALATGRMPRGLRDAGAYGIGYGAQMRAYLFLITDRYPNSDPTALLDSLQRPPQHPVHLVGDPHDLRRSRLTVFFRLPLFIPHYIWLELWTVAALILGVINWFATLIAGRPPRAFHRFFAAYVRYQLHVYAFMTLAANPFPGFTGAAGTYPLDLVVPAEPQPQHRLKTFFRLVLAIPAFLVDIVLVYCALVAAVFTWFVALLRAEAPWGLRNLTAYALRYQAQTNAYLYLLTDRYPHASPLEGEEPPAPDPEPFEPAPTAA
ncbi:MAG: DUF4389 domain-containing protein [Actinomycetota bacterium]